MLEALLTKGFLPKELPSIFNSSGLGALASRDPSLLPDPLTTKSPRWTEPITHNFARVGGLRRRLSTPNPMNFYRLARAFEDHQGMLNSVWAKSLYSQTRPALGGQQNRALSDPPRMRSIPKAQSRVGARYLVAADISQFYPSVYTHTIPWALHGKREAKAGKHDQTLAGNIIDTEIRACQNGQTKGIAIGPDTSLGVAELILGVVDELLARECNILGGVRFIDDMEYSHATLSDAEQTLMRLEGLLHEYELQLNGAKTKLIELPYQLDSPYVPPLNLYSPQSGTRSPSEWVNYFDTAFALAKESPNEGVLRYAIGALRRKDVYVGVWELVQSLLWQCLALDPGTLRFIVEALLFNVDTQGFEVDRDLASKAVNGLIKRSAPVGHGSEVAWGIWAAMRLDLKLDGDAQSKIAEVDDDYVATLAMLNRDKLFDVGYEPPLWQGWLEEDCFVSDHWLYCYEAYNRGWMTGAVTVSGIGRDPVAAWMKAEGISFLDEGAVDTPPGEADYATVSG